MIEQNIVNHKLEIYTPRLQWKGDLPLAAFRRLSDFLNDSSFRSIQLNRVELTPLVKKNDRRATGPAPQEQAPGQGSEAAALVQTAVIGKESIIVIVAPTPAQPRANPIDRVAKVPFRMMFHISPLAAVGSIFLARNARWDEALMSLRQDFVIVTDATIWSPDYGIVFGTNLDFAMISRKWIAGMYPLNQGRSEAASF
jgi:hypothetical protein